MNIINFLKGKKTYIIGALMITLGILQNESQMILEGISFITLRAGVSKLEAQNSNQQSPDYYRDNHN